MTEFSDSQLLHIYCEIYLGRGQHGSFLMAFAGALVRADEQNFSLLKNPAQEIAIQYGLDKYLDNYNPDAYQKLT